jgi:hypothetical protein
MEQFRGGLNQLELYGVFAFGAARKVMTAEQSYLMWNPVGLMNNAVNPAFRNCLSGPKDRFVFRHT